MEFLFAIENTHRQKSLPLKKPDTSKKVGNSVCQTNGIKKIIPSGSGKGFMRNNKNSLRWGEETTYCLFCRQKTLITNKPLRDYQIKP